jgi:hypothetical protein
MLARGRLGRALVGAAGVSLAVAMLGSSVTATAAVAPQHRVAAAVAGSLDSVSCVSSSSCVAVGSRSAGAGTLVEKWNGTKWSVVSSPNPSGSSGSTLWGVACTSATSCLAVGDYNNSAHTATLPTAERWNGSKWSVLTVPAPSGATAAFLGAVSCASATTCQATGSSAAGTSSSITLAESWNGTKWSIESTPSPNPGKPDTLTGVSCPSASLCWAVGYTFPTNFTGTLTEKWNGSKWSVVTTPTSKANQAIGDACFSTSACMTVGISNSLFAFAQDWNGTTWKLTPAPGKPSGATTSELNAVACAAAATCEAAGTYNKSGSSPALAEGWNGTKWTVQSTPAIGGSTFASLQGVSCTASSNCWAVGENISSSATDPLIEKWNGTSWSVTAS